MQSFSDLPSIKTSIFSGHRQLGGNKKLPKVEQHLISQMLFRCRVFYPAGGFLRGEEPLKYPHRYPSYSAIICIDIILVAPEVDNSISTAGDDFGIFKSNDTTSPEDFTNFSITGNFLSIAGKFFL